MHGCNERENGHGRDDERLRELMQQAFAPVDAPDDIYERIADMSKQTDKKALAGWAHRVPLRAAVAAALSTVAIASVAVAAANTDFFASAFGPKGQEDVPAHEFAPDGKDTLVAAPSRTWADVDPDEAERLVGAYVEEVGQSAAVDGYTLTVDACLVDENGLGVATYTVSNPDGVQVVDAGYGEFYWKSDAPVSDVGLTGGGERYEDQAYDYRDIKDNDRSTETELHAVEYFGPFFADGVELDAYDGAGELGDEMAGGALSAAGDGALVWNLPAQGTGGAAGALVTFKPTKELPAMAFSSEDGAVSASVSALGVMVGSPADSDSALPGEDWTRVVIRFADGSEYVVLDDGVSNLTTSYIYEDGGRGGLAILFNRLVDTQDIASIEVADCQGASFTLTRA